jgi:hypothetical protein
MTDDERRQAMRQAQEWQADAEALKRELTQAGAVTREFDDMIKDIQGLTKPDAYVDPANLAALQALALEKVKQLEFGLQKKLDGGDQPLSLSSSDEVPAGFRDAIAEYYKSLAKK